LNNISFHYYAATYCHLVGGVERIRTSDTAFDRITV
jgi:hypothetical protein